jgi:hypothetical protein
MDVTRPMPRSSVRKIYDSQHNHDPATRTSMLSEMSILPCSRPTWLAMNVFAMNAMEMSNRQLQLVTSPFRNSHYYIKLFPGRRGFASDETAGPHYFLQQREFTPSHTCVWSYIAIGLYHDFAAIKNNDTGVDGLRCGLGTSNSVHVGDVNFDEVGTSSKPAPKSICSADSPVPFGRIDDEEAALTTRTLMTYRFGPITVRICNPRQKVRDLPS